MDFKERLIHAAKIDDLNVMHEVLGWGIECDFNEIREFGDPVFLIAARCNSLDCLALMIDRGFDIDSLHANNYRVFNGLIAQPTTTALMLAAQHGKYQVVELLLKNGANPNVVNNLGETALTIACFYYGSKYEKTLQLLIDFGADVNHQNDDGSTGLMNVADIEDDIIPMIKILLDNGADTALKNVIGQTFIQVMEDFGNNNAIDFVNSYYERQALKAQIMGDNPNNINLAL